MTCFKVFANKSNFNQHIKRVQTPHVQSAVDKFDDARQSAGQYGDEGVQST